MHHGKQIPEASDRMKEILHLLEYRIRTAEERKAALDDRIDRAIGERVEVQPARAKLGSSAVRRVLQHGGARPGVDVARHVDELRQRAALLLYEPLQLARFLPGLGVRFANE